MNICYISSIDISLPNGPGVNEREFLSTLQKEARQRGDQVTFLIPKPSGWVDISLENAVFYRKKATDETLTHGRLVVHFIGLMKILLTRIMSRPNILFVVRLSSETLAVPVVLRLCRKPYYIKTLEDVYGFAAPTTKGWTRFNYLIKRFLLGVVLHKAVFIDASTRQLVDTYRERFNLKNITHIDNAVNIERFDVRDKEASRTRCGLQSFNKIVGYCGGFPSQRGAGQLIQIARRLHQAFEDCGILIVGHDAQLDALKRQVRETNMHQQVIFKGIVSYEKMTDYINCLDAGIALDTPERVGRYGNSSQKIRQYLACGVPVICPEKTNPEIVDQGLAVSVAVSNLDEIFRAVQFFFNLTPTEISLYQAKARRYATKTLSTDVAFERRYRFWKRVHQLQDT
jgi:glycosyltransferase involved in cell wall biosynthesis